MRLSVLAALLLLSVEGAPSEVPSAKEHLIEAEIFHSRGTYVGGYREDVVGLEARWLVQTSKWSFHAALPVLSVSDSPADDETVTPSGGGQAPGRPIAVEGGVWVERPGDWKMRRTGPGPGGRGQEGGNGPQSLPLEEGRQTGAGDVRLQVGRRLGEKTGFHRFHVRGGLKIPTGDEDRALGSGEFDSWAGISWSREGWITDVAAHIDYERLGDPEGTTLEDGFGLGVSFQWPLERRGIFVAAEAAHPVFEGDPVRASASAGFWWPMGTSHEWSLQALAGLTESAPDFGFSLTFRTRG